MSNQAWASSKLSGLVGQVKQTDENYAAVAVAAGGFLAVAVTGQRARGNASPD